MFTTYSDTFSSPQLAKCHKPMIHAKKFLPLITEISNALFTTNHIYYYQEKIEYN